ncbi:MAG TPA: sulfate permease [Longimicrobiales bacterium]|nr:sulfate permease [Longimicrobiales bacterium]
MQLPALLTGLRGYTRRQATSDVVSGVIVGIVALPLAIAFAIASGMPPEAGLYTAIVAGFLISALGGSMVQIGGPTGAFVVIVYGVVQQHGVDGLLVATLMAGAILVVMGAAGLGAAIKFIPFPVTTGFTAGIAVVIFSSQIRDLLGLDMGEVPADFLEKWTAFAAHIGTLNPWAVVVTALSFLILVGWPSLSRRVPAPFVALAAATVVVAVFGLDVETIGSRFGDVSARLPRPRVPEISLPLVRELIGPATAIALLAAIESLLSAVVADGMTGGRHRSNVELVAQGVANIASPLFGGMPATGAIARTATNVRNGGRTPVAGMVHAATLLLILLFFGRLVAYVPLAALGAILVVVAVHMSDWRTFLAEFRAPKSDVVVLLTTFGLTVLIDLVIALEVGMILAAFLFMRRMAEVTSVAAVRPADGTEPGGEPLPALPDGVVVYEIEGPFFFGAAEKFKETLGEIADPPRALILGMRRVSAIDSTGLNALRDLVRRARRDGTQVFLWGVHAQPMAALARSGFLDEIREADLVGSVEEALEALGAERAAR